MLFSLELTVNKEENKNNSNELTLSPNPTTDYLLISGELMKVIMLKSGQF